MDTPNDIPCPEKKRKASIESRTLCSAAAVGAAAAVVVAAQGGGAAGAGAADADSLFLKRCELPLGMCGWLEIPERIAS